MALINLEYGKHWRYEVSGVPRGVVIDTKIKPEVSKWLSQNAVRHTIIHGLELQICILDSKKAMLFKLTWL